METKQDSKIILGMIMLNDSNSFDVDVFRRDFENKFDKNINEPTGDKATFVFRVDGEMVTIAHMDIPIPSGDMEETAQYAYNWQTVLEDTKDHKSHLIVSLMRGGNDQIKRFRTFTQIICSLLSTTNAIGVYKGNQSLLIPQDDYLNEAEAMSDDYLPLNLWIYFGLRATENGNSGYTFGLKEFNKAEMEIINSSRSLEDIRGFLFDIAHYVLGYDVMFEDGQTVGVSEDERIEISSSNGMFVEGDTFRLAY